MSALSEQRWIYLDLGEVVEEGDTEVTICILPRENEAIGELLASAPRFLRLAMRVAALNPDAGEIGAGMLAQLVAEARIAVAMVAEASS